MNSSISHKKTKTPWPTKDAMEQIYEMKLWGSGEASFYSGAGSHNTDIINPYKEALLSFLQSFENPLTVCDLGCGDFNIGKDLVNHTKQYTGVDIVGDLIAYNKEKFKAVNLAFQCLDIATDDLPTGNCAIVRQVLQHLSNKEIQQVLCKLIDFKYVILTEHIPEGEFIPNKDIISGQGIRLKKQSGVNVIAPPFNFQIKEEKQLTSVILNDNKGIIVTTLYTVF